MVRVYPEVAPIRALSKNRTLWNTRLSITGGLRQDEKPTLKELGQTSPAKSAPIAEVVALSCSAPQTAASFPTRVGRPSRVATHALLTQHGSQDLLCKP